MVRLVALAKKISRIGFHKKNGPKLVELASAREQSVDALLQSRPDLAGFKGSTKIPAHFLSVKNLDIEASGVENGHPYVRLRSGRIFYGLAQPESAGRAYDLLADLLPSAVKRETMLLAGDIAFRYIRSNYLKFLPKQASLAIEVGAYHGIKAIRILDQMKDGQVVAIEMMPENHELLIKNIEANGLAGKVIPIMAGAWNEKLTTMIASNGYQKNSVKQIDGRNWSKEPSIEVNLDTIDNIIEARGIEHADFVNFQINGAENEALQGLRRNMHRIGIMRIIAPYSRAGASSVAACEETLEKMDCVVLQKSEKILIATPRKNEEKYAWVRDAGSPHELDTSPFL